MKKRFVIIHYNTPLLTECLVRSINLFVKDAIIYIFDNSDKKPFTAFFPNVLVLDNTKGQIIDFDKWLEKYPNKGLSAGKRNYWGSAKHCYSVEKCMQIIGENFILLDSDVLLKKDCSDFFKEDCIYVGETITQPNSIIKRLLPFICFINTKMCLENNIHYFDENFMHGLRKTTEGDKWDTGASFHKKCSSIKHFNTKISEYIVHYNNASWMDTTIKKHDLSPTDWVYLHKKYWSTEKNKKVIYTCITGSYDNLTTPKFITHDFDYVCFTDNKNLTSNIWEIKPLPKETEELSQIKKQRYVKINAHKVVGEYDLSIWVDGNVVIKDNLNDFVSEVMKDDISVYVPKHPQRNCIYDEAKEVVLLKKDKEEIVNPQLDKYKEDGFPNNYGLLQSNIMLRKHNDENCIKLMEDWFSELKEHSHRDQLSFNYVAWKNKDIKFAYLDKSIYRSKWFNWLIGHAKREKEMESKTIFKKTVIEVANDSYKKKRIKVSTKDVNIY